MRTVEKLPDGCKALSVKYVFKRKFDAQGLLERFKARLVTRGFQQREGIDYDELFAPTAKMTTLRALIAKAVKRNWQIWQGDVLSAFLNSDLEEEVYIEAPDGLELLGDPELSKAKYFRLYKSLY